MREPRKKPPTKRDILKRVAQVKAGIAAKRDELRALISDVEDVVESSDRAVDALDEAVAALSEHL